MGEYLNVRLRKQSFGKSRELTRQRLISLGQSLLEGKYKPGCELCDGHGRIKHPVQPIGWKTEICGCLVEYESLKHSAKLLDHSNLPQIDLEIWQESEDLDFELLLKFIDKERWVFLHGDTGTGKSFTTAIMGYISLLREKSVYFSSVPQLMDDLRPNDAEPKLRDMTKYKCKKADVLILDDIGQEKASDWVREQLHLIIDWRYNKKLQTIFTSNFPVENLEATLSKAIYSRVKGQCKDTEFLIQSLEDRRLISP